MLVVKLLSDRLEPMPTSASGLAPGTRIDRFVIERPLGEGGFGAVYRARHTLLGHTVALKLLHPEHATSEEIQERFTREARATAAVGSEHIVKVLDCGSSDEGWLYLAMELLEGMSLEAVINELGGVMQADRVVEIGMQTLRGLEDAHAAGIIHRDLKPANIYLTTDAVTGDEVVKLLDFGVSKVTNPEQHTALTQTGAMLGTPLYMAPEQFHNARDVDHRVDLYSAAAVVYQLLSGRTPYEADTYADLVVRLCCEAPPPLARVAPDVPQALGVVVMKGLATYPEERWSDASAFAEALKVAHETGEAPGVTLPTHPGEATQPGTAIPIDEFAPTQQPSAIPAFPPPRPGGGTMPYQAGPGEPPGTGGGFNVHSQAPSHSQAPAQPTPAGAAAISYIPTGERVAPPPHQVDAPSKPWKRWLLLLVALPLLLMLLGGLVGGIIWAVLDLGNEPTSVAPLDTPQPGPVIANPQPQPVPQQPFPIPDLGLPQPTEVNTEDPIGELLTTVLGGVGEGMAGGASPVPMQGGSTPGIQLYEPQIVGGLDYSAVRQAMLASEPSLVNCRRAGQHNRVRVQIHINLNQIMVAAPAATNTGPVDVARCCADQFRGSVPSGWSPGASGMFFFDVGLLPP